ncbi:hypothetical protein KC19_VG338800 [Ceratodon purpureus]|uniref:Uncharacterized protein n=1 Tax=Ceratodon purpureus TaxID=3225 RepID=A0A8T0HXF0_CERPU|nr:hypothetical protein KC19_VG338800 [Ceratodon purpureus]
MANSLRQRLGALLTRPISAPVQASQAAPGAKRFFASKSHAHDDVEETQKWRSITIAAYIMCMSMGIYTLANEEHHGGHNPVCCSLTHSCAQCGLCCTRCIVVISLAEPCFRIIPHRFSLSWKFEGEEVLIFSRCLYWLE